MDTNNNREKWVNEALSSVDGIERATARPFLLTRINARMNNGTATMWEKAGWLITRPAVAFSGLCLIVLINVMVLVKSGSLNTVNTADQVAQNSTDEFTTVATIYDLENTQP